MVRWSLWMSAAAQLSVLWSLCASEGSLPSQATWSEVTLSGAQSAAEL
jgi:hypothetical protein